MASSNPQRTMMRVEGLVALQALIRCETRSHTLDYSFDLRNGQYVALQRDLTRDEDLISGPMTLANYNELKLSQYLAEDTEHSTRYVRQFSITDRGRRLMEEGTSRDS